MDESLFGDHLVFRYTRAQAIADGVLSDLTQGEFAEVTRSHFKVHVACTALVFAQLNEVVEAGDGDWKGILNDIYSVGKSPFTRVEFVGNGEERHFTVTFGMKAFALKIHAGPGDDGELVLTLMEENED